VTSNPAIIQAAKVTAGAIMIAFMILGLLVGYIVTSTWYEWRLVTMYTRTDQAPQQNPSKDANVPGSGTAQGKQVA
jgi:hypothetical protein